MIAHPGARQAARVMLLVDADNVTADVIEQALQHVLERHGAAHVRRAYCTTELAHKHLKLFKTLSIRPMVNISSGKNSTDIALAVDAMDLVMAERPDIVVLVSSDSDFAPLVIRLREKGCRVEGIGQEGKTGEDSKPVYDDFFDIAHRKGRSGGAADAPAPARKTAARKSAAGRAVGKRAAAAAPAAAPAGSAAAAPISPPPPPQPQPQPQPRPSPSRSRARSSQQQPQVTAPPAAPAEATRATQPAASAAAPAPAAAAGSARRGASRRRAASSAAPASAPSASSASPSANAQPSVPAAPTSAAPARVAPAPARAAGEAGGAAASGGLPEEVERILAALPELNYGERVQLNQARERLHAAGLLARSAPSTKLFRKHPALFLLTPEKTPNKVQFVRPPAR